MISLKSIFRSQELKIEILQYINDAILNFKNEIWWKYNEASLCRNLRYITSKKNSRKIIEQAKQFDQFYLKQIAYELSNQLRRNK